MSPHKYIKTVAGVHGGLLIIAGAVFTAIGLTWLGWDSASRVQGVGWIPWRAINPTLVGGMWIFAGVTGIVAGWFSKGHRLLENAAYYVVCFVPVLLAIWFLFGWAQGYAPTGFITAISYTGYAALIGWVASRVKEADTGVVPRA